MPRSETTAEHRRSLTRELAELTREMTLIIKTAVHTDLRQRCIRMQGRHGRLDATVHDEVAGGETEDALKVAVQLALRASAQLGEGGYGERLRVVPLNVLEHRRKTGALRQMTQTSMVWTVHSHEAYDPAAGIQNRQLRRAIPT